MRTILTGAGLAGLLLMASPGMAATSFTTMLDQSQNISPSGNPATGMGTLEIENATPTAMRFSYSLMFDSVLDFSQVAAGRSKAAIDMDFMGDPNANNIVNMMHIHQNVRGAAGPVVYGLFNPDTDFDDDILVEITGAGTKITGSWGPADGLEPIWDIFGTDLDPLGPGEDSNLYFNVHTVGNQAGAIRGQIVAAPVPLPAGAALLPAALGLAALAARRRPRRPSEA
jgi:serralysin